MKRDRTGGIWAVNYTIFGAGDMEAMACLVLGEKDVGWKWGEDGRASVEVN